MDQLNLKVIQNSPVWKVEFTVVPGRENNNDRDCSLIGTLGFPSVSIPVRDIMPAKCVCVSVLCFVKPNLTFSLPPSLSPRLLRALPCRRGSPLLIGVRSKYELSTENIPIQYNSGELCSFPLSASIRLRCTLNLSHAAAMSVYTPARTDTHTLHSGRTNPGFLHEPA